MTFEKKKCIMLVVGFAPHQFKTQNRRIHNTLTALKPKLEIINSYVKEKQIIV